MDTGKIGGGDDLGVSGKIVPAYSNDHTLATHMEGLELPLIFLHERPGFRTVQENGSMQVWYKRSFVCYRRRVCHQTLFIECMAEADPSEYIWLAPTGGGQNGAQICELVKIMVSPFLLLCIADSDVGLRASRLDCSRPRLKVRRPRL